MNILVSACLLGIACKYSGGDNACPALLQALRQSGHTLIPVCPEVYGGLPTPRPPAERCGDRVLTEAGTDVTAQYTIQKDGTALKSGDPVLTAQNGESPKIPLTFVKPDAAPYAGSYTGTVTFTVSVGDKTPTT